MKMKKITASTMPEAMEKVKKELGPDAVIFHTKKVKKAKFFNLFKTENIEVFAANDPYPLDIRKDPVFPDPVEPSAGSSKSKSDWEKVMKQSIEERANTGKPVKSSEGVFNDLSYLEPSEAIGNLQDRLKNQGIDQKWIDDWTRRLVKAWYKSDEPLESSELSQMLAKHIQSELKLPESEALLPGERLISLVGPTGVGKTTTLAKLAAKAVIEQGQKAAFITIDTYRIAAIEQLKTYAGILNAPVEVAYTAEDFKQALEKLSAYDRIFIDTAGRNYRENHYVDELKALLPYKEGMAIYLVMSATSKYEDMNEIINQFKQVPTKGLVFTKIDETGSLGSILNLLLHQPEQKLSFLTNGQDVPDDIEKATADQLTAPLFAGNTDV